jgi:uncharacterized protein (TIGR02466 family)
MFINAQNERKLNLFSSPLIIEHKPEYLPDVDRASTPVINKIIKKYKKEKKEIPNSYHSDNLWKMNIPEYQPLIHYVLQKSFDVLKSWGYKLDNRISCLTEIWVQEFPKEGGYHSEHIHANNHVSGFYFLRCSETTSHPVFHDPRHGKRMTDLAEIEHDKISNASQKIFFKVKPGDLMFFPSYIPHSYVHHKGEESFRFIHFNMQALLNTNK